MQRTQIGKALVWLTLGVATGWIFRDYLADRSEKDLGASPIERRLDWGEHYFEPTDEMVEPLALLDVDRLGKLLGAGFEGSTPININEHSGLPFCKTEFGQASYLLTSPRPVGSFRNSIIGYDFIIRDPADPRRDTDVDLSILFDEQRRILSAVFSGKRFGRSHQVTMKSGVSAVALAASVEKALRRAAGGDNGESYWSVLPNFVAKLIVAVDNHILREA